MFGIGETEFVIILIFGFLLFGPDKLPGMGRTLGRVLRQFREASEGFTEVVQTNVIDPATKELNNTGSTKRTPAAAQQAAQDDDDADIEEPAEASEGAAPRKRETFAERKARLQAEQAAREEEAAKKAAAQADAPATDADDDDADAPDAVAAAGTDAPDAPAKAEPEEKPEPAGPSVADLYARGSHRSSRAKAQEESQAAEQASDADSPDADGVVTAAPAEVSPEPESASAPQPGEETTTGEEESHA